MTKQIKFSKAEDSLWMELAAKKPIGLVSAEKGHAGTFKDFLKWCADPNRERFDEEDIRDFEEVLSECRGRPVKIRLPD